MTELFKRNYSLTITNLLSSQAITVDKLRCTFKLLKTNSAKANNASINVFNLSPASRKALTVLDTTEGTPQVQVALSAGYGSSATLLFKGTGSSYTDWKAPNYITVLSISDGVVFVANTVFNKAYPKLTSVDVIVQDVLKVSALPKGNIFKTGKALSKGRSFSGTVDKILDDLGNDFGFVYEVNNEINNIFSSTQALRNVAIVKLSGKTGMIGSPYKKGNVVKVKCLIIPEITPNSLIDLFCEDVNLRGTYLVSRVVTKGDNYGPDWWMSLELDPYSTMPSFLTLPGIREGSLA